MARKKEQRHREIDQVDAENEQRKREIELKNVTLHNLKGVNLRLPHGKLIVFTGVSGSGKSSLAFDTIYVEGQRRYLSSLSSHLRRDLLHLPKPEAEAIFGISPTIAIEQKLSLKHPRSTVGTITGIYDHLRILFARAATAYCPISGTPLSIQSKEEIAKKIQDYPTGSKVYILAPYIEGGKGAFEEELKDLLRRGFLRARIDNEILELSGDERLDPKKKHTIEIVVDRIVVEPSSSDRITEAVSQALELGKGVLTVHHLERQTDELFSLTAFSKGANLSYAPLDPVDFSFNHPKGMCERCQGLGVTLDFDLEKVIDPEKSISEDCCSVATSYKTIRYKNIYDNLASLYKFDLSTPWKDLPSKAQEIFLYGSKERWIKMHFTHPIKQTEWTDYVSWKGVLSEAKKRFEEAKSQFYKDTLQELMHEEVCQACQGARIKPYPAASKLAHLTIQQLTHLTIDELQSYFSSLSSSKSGKLPLLTPLQFQIAEPLIQEIQKRLSFLEEVGLSYLTLERGAPTLSGGEYQRIRLSSEIGSGLVQATYVLDEPSIGLHAQDHGRLIQTLHSLKDLGNTVIVVEHDEQTIESADLLVDVGPLAGKEGGEILYTGTPLGVLDCERSLTGQYLSGKLGIPLPTKRRELTPGFVIEKGTLHNLNNLSVNIPLGGLICITGVSGSGKSTLIHDLLLPSLMGKKAPCQVLGQDKIDKVIAIDQSPIGRTPRSNLATYVKLLDDIRILLAELPESRKRGYTQSHFSFNVKEGSCSYCKGLGQVKIDLDFMEETFATCSQCQGKRFDPEILDIRYKGKNIYDILEMDARSCLEHFSAQPTIRKKLELICEVGLGYLAIGQPSTTLSGGEAQRIKLAKELVRPSTGKTLYILDEPTTGLHFHDIAKLVQIFNKLLELGNSIILIEHHLELIKLADHIIDLGPGPGKNGGRIIGEGTPESISLLNTPTGRSMKDLLDKERMKAKKNLAKTPQKAPPVSEGVEEIKQLPDLVVDSASLHNLKKVSLSLKIGSFTVFTGVSGSGKSSLAFDTIYAEGQRRYVESLPLYLRQYLKLLDKPKVESITGLPPTIALEQKNHGANPRSTLGTVTEVYDYLRLLFAHLGTAFCPETGEEIRQISKETVVKKLLSLPSNEKIILLSPLYPSRDEEIHDLQQRLFKEGFLRVRLNGTYYECDEVIPYVKAKKNELLLVIDRLLIHPGIETRLYESIEKAASLSDGIILVDRGEEDLYFNLKFSTEKSGRSYPPLTPKTFSFNSEQGCCPECQGLGTIYGINLLHDPILDNLSIANLFEHFFKDETKQGTRRIFFAYFTRLKVDPYCPFGKLSLAQKRLILEGSDEEIEIEPGYKLSWKGLGPVLAKAAKVASTNIKEELQPLMEERTCPACNGSRLNPLARHVKIEGMTLVDLTSMPIKLTKDFINSLISEGKIPHFLTEVAELIAKPLELLTELGLDYLSLNRSAPSLSGGEMQRVRLGSQLGSGLCSCLYVLDEPTVGLHPHNMHLLLQALKKLQQHNTLLIIEHEPMIIKEADQIFDFGPLAGKKGGQIVASGTLSDIKNHSESLTGAYLSLRKQIPVPAKRRSPKGHIFIKKATAHNLKSIDVHLPIGAMSCITGVSGSGKSSLLEDVLKKAATESILQHHKADAIDTGHGYVSHLSHFQKLIAIDQHPIGQTIRADISTYTDTMTHLRSFFAALPLAKARGYQPRHFSYNHKHGMCKTCFGLGSKTIDLAFLPSIKTPCETCHGYKINTSSQQVLYKGKHLGQVLALSIDEAALFFEAIPQLARQLTTLISLGLGYLTLGQELVTLSGGEAQRVRLSKELSKRSAGKSLYLIDEPTTGLHPDDIAKLLPLLHQLVDKGNTVILIEHNLDMIANADYIVDLGPHAGDEGGFVVATGTPEEICSHPLSLTGKYLKPFLEEASLAKCFACV